MSVACLINLSTCFFTSNVSLGEKSLPVSLFDILLIIVMAFSFRISGMLASTSSGKDWFSFSLEMISFGISVSSYIVIDFSLACFASASSSFFGVSNLQLIRGS